jgi:hypothetical protein
MLGLRWRQPPLLQPPADVLLRGGLGRCCLLAAHGPHLHLPLLLHLPAAVALTWVLLQCEGGQQGVLLPVLLLLLMLRGLRGLLLLLHCSAWH